MVSRFKFFFKKLKPRNELGKISQEKAAEMAGLNREEFLLSLSSLQVSPFQYTVQEIEEELRDVH